MKMLIPCLVSVVALLTAVPAQSAETDLTPQEIEKLAKELVLKLGSPRFREREVANRELVKLGLAALKAIEAGRNNPDPEIMARCKSLYATIRELDLKRRIDELAADKDGRMANTLPLGATYFKICGNDENARKFYFELCNTHFQMLEDAANNFQMNGKAYIDLINEIEKRGKGDLNPATEGAAMLLIGADEKIGPSIDEANRKQTKGGDRNYQRLIGILWTPKYEALMTDPNNGRYFRKLLFAWAKRLPEPLAMSSFLFFIQDMNKKQVINLQSDSEALEFLMDLALSTPPQRLPYHKGTAMAILANNSKNDRIAFFEEKLFKDESVLLPDNLIKIDDNKNIRIETRACDYALAICVKLSGQSYADYGFGILGSQSDKDASVYSGFTNDETRKAAFKKYAEWRKANPITKD